MKSFEKSRRMIAEASRYLPGGVNSNFRLGMVPTPLIFERGEGPYLYDVDGNCLNRLLSGHGADDFGAQSGIRAVCCSGTARVGYSLCRADSG